MSTDAFGDLMASVDPALIVVTATAEGEKAGCLVGFHAQSSIDPRRYSVWLSKANHTYSVALRATYLGIHFLTSADLDIAELFGTQTGDEVDKFEFAPWAYSVEGAPMLSRLPHQVVVRRTALIDDEGDHACFTTEPVVAYGPERFVPLRLSQASHLAPGHDSDDRR